MLIIISFSSERPAGTHFIDRHEPSSRAPDEQDQDSHRSASARLRAISTSRPSPASDAFELVAVVESRTARSKACRASRISKSCSGVRAGRSRPSRSATTPQVRYEAGATVHSSKAVIVLLEKSRRGATISEVQALRSSLQNRGRDSLRLLALHRFASPRWSLRAPGSLRAGSRVFLAWYGRRTSASGNPGLRTGSGRAADSACVRSRHQRLVDPDSHPSQPSPDVAGSGVVYPSNCVKRRLPRACCSPTRVARRSARSWIFDRPDRRAGTSSRNQ